MDIRPKSYSFWSLGFVAMSKIIKIAGWFGLPRAIVVDGRGGHA
jgi:hypothetical protein